MLNSFGKISKDNKPTLIKQVLLITLFSVLIVFFAQSFFNVYRSYAKGEKEIVTKTNEIVGTIQRSLSDAVWELDKDTIENVLSVLVANPNVLRAEFSNNEFKIMKNSIESDSDWITLNFPVTHLDNSKKRIDLGNLKLTLTKDNFHKRLKVSLFYSLIEDLIHFIVVGICIVWLLNKKIIMPMSKIKAMNDRFTKEHLSPFIIENEQTLYRNSLTELERLELDIHRLQQNFLQAFREQKLSEEARYEAEVKLLKEEQNRAMSQRLETIGQITAQVSHDFANLIMIISNKSKLLQKNLTEETHLKDLDIITKTAVKAQSLSKKLLSLTRMQKDEYSLLDPFQLIFEMEDLIKMSIGRNIDFQLTTSEEQYFVLINRSAFENAILNLCVNARDAMPDGGKLSILLKSSIIHDDQFVSISICDSGTGIPAEIRERIFDPFFTTKDVGKGTGLGLAQVLEFVKKSNGILNLDSNENGTCFEINLPKKAIENKIVA